MQDCKQGQACAF